MISYVEFTVILILKPKVQEKKQYVKMNLKVNPLFIWPTAYQILENYNAVWALMQHVM